MAVLLLIAAIATFISWIAGILTRKRNKASDYQAHSAKFKNVLSIEYLGCEVLRRGFKICITEFTEGIKLLTQLVLQQEELCHDNR